MAQKKIKNEEASQKRMIQVLRTLEREYPEAECSLIFSSPFQLLIATMLSAQCTDERVNQVTPRLFERFPRAFEMAQAKVSEIEELIRSVNFYKTKAKAISQTSQVLIEKYQGEVPPSMDELVHLRGVGRKTANVVLGVGFGIPSLVVYTHVGRVSRRLGFTRSSDPVRVEQELMRIVPKNQWTHYAHWMISHGRAVCTARKAWCEKCSISSYCEKVGQK